MARLQSLILLFTFFIVQGGCMTENTTMYFTFNDAALTSKSPDPSSLYVEGKMLNGRFTPQSEVLGKGAFASQGEPGWVELTSGQFYPMHTARAPSSPYVEGFLTQHGFVPSSRAIK